MEEICNQPTLDRTETAGRPQRLLIHTRVSEKKLTGPIGLGSRLFLETQEPFRRCGQNCPAGVGSWKRLGRTAFLQFYLLFQLFFAVQQARQLTLDQPGKVQVNTEVEGNCFHCQHPTCNETTSDRGVKHAWQKEPEDIPTSCRFS